MIHLPLYLEKKLKTLFPTESERNRFVGDLVKNALEEQKPAFEQEGLPLSVGGTLHLYTDGGSRGNPGSAAIGCVLTDPETHEVIKEHGERIGVQTNNVAEYQALIVGLELAQQYRPNRLVCHLDSELVVKQLNGEYKVKMPTLQPLVERVLTLTKEFANVAFVYVPRSKNAHADRLVNRALDAK